MSKLKLNITVEELADLLRIGRDAVSNEVLLHHAHRMLAADALYDVLNGPISDILTGDQMAETGAYAALALADGKGGNM